MLGFPWPAIRQDNQSSSESTTGNMQETKHSALISVLLQLSRLVMPSLCFDKTTCTSWTCTLGKISLFKNVITRIFKFLFLRVSNETHASVGQFANIHISLIVSSYSGGKQSKMSDNGSRDGDRKRDVKDRVGKDDTPRIVETLIIDDVPGHRKLNLMDAKLDALLVGQAALQTVSYFILLNS